jgi:hypothetical protein
MESVTHPGIAHPRAESVAVIPWYLSALLVGSTSIILGLLWDLSWHLSIGRDTLWSPPHLAIYLGGVLGGLSCGALALKTTFAGSAAERAVSVRFWGFRAPLGAWVAIWGALALLVSAPFDNWWHNAYGLDIDRFTPPHSLLLLGMITIQIGTLMLALSTQNRAPAGEVNKLGIAHLYTAGVVVAMMLPVHIMEPQRQHGGIWYQVMGTYVPFMLVSVARSSRVRWAAAITSAFYMLIVSVMVWILPLFPAQPRLGPILTQVDHMSAPLFPLFLVIPSLAIDFFLQRRPEKRAGWLDSVVIGAGFLLLFLAVHWNTSAFLLSPAARNWFFGADRFISYAFPRPGPTYYRFWDEEPVSVVSFGIALLCAIASTRVGLWWGKWMAGLRR